jgi:hypothetical protein
MPDEPADDHGALEAELRDALHDVDAPAVSADPAIVDELARRSTARRRAKLTAGSLAAAAVVIALGLGLLLSNRSSSSTLVAGPASSSTTALNTLPSSTTSDSSTLSIPPTTYATSTSDTTPGPGSIPITTVPPPTEPGSSSSTSTSTSDRPRDCGSSTPSGWPTTTMFSPVASQCLLDGFAWGVADTFHEVIPDSDYPAHQITKDFTVVGVRVVQVRVDRSQALQAPNDVVTYRCTQLTYQMDAPEVYAYGGCTVVG